MKARGTKWDPSTGATVCGVLPVAAKPNIARIAGYVLFVVHTHRHKIKRGRYILMLATNKRSFLLGGEHTCRTVVIRTKFVLGKNAGIYKVDFVRRMSPDCYGPP